MWARTKFHEWILDKWLKGKNISWTMTRLRAKQKVRIMNQEREYKALLVIHLSSIIMKRKISGFKAKQELLSVLKIKFFQLYLE